VLGGKRRAVGAVSGAAWSPPSGVSGKVIVITGGGGGLGSAMTLELCRLGARVLATGRTLSTLEEAVAAVEASLGPGRAAAVPCDVREPASIEAMLDACTDVLGVPDGLVNNASGLFPVHARALSANGFRAVVDIVLNGTWNCTSAVARRWLDARRPGAVVNVLTPYAWMGGPGLVHTASAKGGVLTMTRTLGVEWAPHGIRVNAVAPGWMRVGGTAALASTPEAEARLLHSIPAGRWLRPEETARSVAYLLSDDSAYVCGHCLVIDGAHHLSTGLFQFVDDLPARAPAAAAVRESG
jgi:NAD(P)-dependent dehydrogenase (short-subunit alcohol dehydrogenase family)